MKEFFKISFEDEIPKYVQIANRIRKLIDNKDISDGEKLPTIRERTNIII